MRGVTSDEQLKAINALANKKGLEYYIDDATGMAMLRPSTTLQTPIAPKFNTQTIDTSKAVINPNTGKVSGLPNIGGAAPTRANPSETRGTTSGGGIRQILGNLDPTAFIQAGRMMGNIWNNNRVAKKTKEGIKSIIT